MEIKISTDLAKLKTELGDFNSKQLPYAVSKTLNILADKSSDVIRKEFGDKLEIRNKGLLKIGVRVEKSNKNQWPYIQSEVGTNKNLGFLDDHIEGQKRVSLGSLGRATPNVKLIKRSASGKVAPNKRPKALLKKTGKKAPFIVTFKSGKRAIVQRTTNERLPLQVLFALHREAKINGVVDFYSVANKAFTREFHSTLGRELSMAIASKKK